MSKGIKFVLHPGMGKTATTTLQQAPFSKHSEIFYIGKNISFKESGKRVFKGYRNNELAKAFSGLLGQSRAEFDSASILKLFERYSEQWDGEKIVVASWEGLISKDTRKFREMLERIKTVGFDVRLLFTIRNQIDWLKSAYLQFLGGHFKDGPSPTFRRPFVSFEAWLTHHQKRTWKGDLPPAYRNADTAMEMFGHDNVKVVCFEEIRRSPEQYFSEIADFIGVARDEFIRHAKGFHANERITSRQIDLIKEYDSSFVRKLKWLVMPSKVIETEFRSLKKQGGVKADVEISKDLCDALYAEASKDNLWFSKVTGLNLRDYGYPFN